MIRKLSYFSTPITVVSRHILINGFGCAVLLILTQLRMVLITDIRHMYIIQSSTKPNYGNNIYFQNYNSYYGFMIKTFMMYKVLYDINFVDGHRSYYHTISVHVLHYAMLRVLYSI